MFVPKDQKTLSYKKLAKERKYKLAIAQEMKDTEQRYMEIIHSDDEKERDEEGTDFVLLRPNPLELTKKKAKHDIKPPGRKREEEVTKNLGRNTQNWLVKKRKYVDFHT